MRSLAKSDEFYGKDEDYWRGAIWMNMNYLGVKALYDYRNSYNGNDSEVKELLEKLYKELRENLIKNLYTEYRKFGYWQRTEIKTIHWVEFIDTEYYN